MMEILFYHLELSPLEKTLPILLEKTLERGWRAIVEVGDEEAAKEIDANLWAFNSDSFLAHAIAGGDNDKDQPILITTKCDNKNSSNVRFFVKGKIVSINDAESTDYERLIFMFDGHDPIIVEQAREAWKNLKEKYDLTYWQQNPSGQWIKKA